MVLMLLWALVYYFSEIFTHAASIFVVKVTDALKLQK